MRTLNVLHLWNRSIRNTYSHRGLRHFIFGNGASVMVCFRPTHNLSCSLKIWSTEPREHCSLLMIGDVCRANKHWEQFSFSVFCLLLRLIVGLLFLISCSWCCCWYWFPLSNRLKLVVLLLLVFLRLYIYNDKWLLISHLENTRIYHKYDL